MAKWNEESKTSAPNAKEPKFENPNIFAMDADPVEISINNGIFDRKDETEVEITKFVGSRRLAREDIDPTKIDANNDDETVEVSATKANIDTYLKAN